MTVQRYLPLPDLLPISKYTYQTTSPAFLMPTPCQAILLGFAPWTSQKKKTAMDAICFSHLRVKINSFASGEFTKALTLNPTRHLNSQNFQQRHIGSSR